MLLIGSAPVRLADDAVFKYFTSDYSSDAFDVILLLQIYSWTRQ